MARPARWPKRTRWQTKSSNGRRSSLWTMMLGSSPASRACSRRWRTGGWDIFTAENHAQALALLAKLRVDVVVLDIGMPGMDGIQFLQLLGRTHPGQQVAMLTGEATEERRKTCLESGAVLFLEKPVLSERLCRHLCRAGRAGGGAAAGGIPGHDAAGGLAGGAAVGVPGPQVFGAGDLHRQGARAHLHLRRGDCARRVGHVAGRGGALRPAGAARRRV